MAQARPGDEIQAMRRFNRFYTRQIGVLEERLLESAFSLPEARVLFEVATRDAPTAAAIAKDLALDAGYLSRLLRGLERRGVLSRTRSEIDGRQSLLSLTASGRQAFAELDARSSADMASLLHKLPTSARGQLVAALATIERLLGGDDPTAMPYLLRPHRPGDIGWIIHRHGVLYAEEYGWDGQFEAFVAEIAAAFIKSFDAARDCCWIAERDRAIAGSVCLVHVSPEIAKLRLLLVEPSARGLGIGRRLVAECIRFARAANYRKITLWTNDVLHAARRLYEAEGFQLVAAEPYHRFGQDLVGQTWELTL